jgi:hypothetical protein
MSADTVWPPAFNPAVYSQDGCSTPLQGRHATYNVGPDQQYKELTDVPWLSLVAGDVVNIYYRDTPYATLVGLRGKGTADKPITINGVTDATCRRPVITGVDAVQATDSKNANFGSDIQGSGIFKIHKSPSDPSDTYKAAYIAIKNLKLTGAKSGNSYYTYAGTKTAYPMFTAAIYAVKVDHLLVENCEIVENGMGIFTNSKGMTNIDYSSYVTLRGNIFNLNGYATDDHEHGIYVQARRALYEGNYIGQARGGSALKDRSSGTVVRYNMIVSSARALDLVETEEQYVANLRSDPLYNYAWVYGNTIVNDFSSPNGYSIRMVHWGFDNDVARARTGVLYFYGNSVIHRGYTSSYWYTSVFQLGTNSYPDMPSSTNYQIDAWDNVFTNQGNTSGTTQWRALWNLGKVNFRGTNYLPTGWLTVSPGGTGTVSTTGSSVLTGTYSTLDSSSYVPTSTSTVLNKGNSYTPDFSALSAAASDFSAANLARTGEYYRLTTPVARAKTVNGTIDLGAFERQ